MQALEDKANIQCNKLMKFGNCMLRYGIYNAETLEKLIETYAHSLGLQHYSTN